MHDSMNPGRRIVYTCHYQGHSPWPFPSHPHAPKIYTTFKDALQEVYG